MNVSYLRTLCVTGLALSLLGSISFAQLKTSDSNTQLGERSQQELGRRTVAELRQQVPFVEDYFIGHYLSGLGDKLSPQLPIGVPYQFHLLKSDQINAFAIQGGFIFFFSGLINAMNSEDELLGVLAHEMAHVKQKHIERMLSQNRVIDVATAAAIIGAVIASNADLAGGVSVLAANYNIDSKLAYSREFEREADRVGFDALQGANLNPEGMIDFFSTLNKLSQTQGTTPPEFLSSHPLSVNRMSDLETRVDKLDKIAPVESIEFDIVRARIAALYSNDDALKHIHGKSEFVDEYLRALRDKTPLDERINTLDKLFKQYPDAVFLIDKAVALYDNQRREEAIELLKTIRPNYPDNPEIPFQTVYFEIDEADWQNACDTLASMRQFEEYYIDYFRQYSRCEYELGNPSLSQFYLGNYYRRLMANDLAQEQYQRALNTGTLSQYHRALALKYSDELSSTDTGRTRRR